MNLFDVVSAAYMAYGAYVGQKRGLSEELNRLLRLGGSLVVGCGVYALLRHAIVHVLRLDPQVSGFTVFAASFGGAFLILHFLRKRLAAWLESGLPTGMQAWGGAVAGVIHKFIAVMALIAAIMVSPLASRPGLESSLFAKVARIFVPAAAATSPASASVPDHSPATELTP